MSTPRPSASLHWSNTASSKGTDFPKGARSVRGPEAGGGQLRPSQSPTVSARPEITLGQCPRQRQVRRPLADVPFSHLHVHSQFSVLQATSSVQALVDKAVEAGMPAMGLTDRGNMMGAFHFVRAANKAGIKPIVGAELNVCRDHADRSKKDDGYPIVLLAKNREGYHRLAKLSSLAYTDGFYYVPRIDREQLLAYKEDLMVTTGGLFSEVPSLLLNVGDRQAEEAFLWWKAEFGAQLLCGTEPPWIGGRKGGQRLLA